MSPAITRSPITRQTASRAPTRAPTQDSATTAAAPDVQISGTGHPSTGPSPAPAVVSSNADGVRAGVRPRARSEQCLRTPDSVPSLRARRSTCTWSSTATPRVAESQASIPRASISLQVSVERPADLAPFERQRAGALGAETATGHALSCCRRRRSSGAQNTITPAPSPGGKLRSSM